MRERITKERRRERETLSELYEVNRTDVNVVHIYVDL